jgi:hypothetical protein
MAKVINTDPTMPKWVINMAREYAERNGMPEITLEQFFETDDYLNQARRNVRGAERAMEADYRATSR